MNKRFLSWIMAIVLGISLTACSGNTAQDTDATQDTDTTPAASNTGNAEALRIQVVVNTTASEYWGYVVAGATAYGEEHEDVEVDVVGPPSQTAYDEQTNMIETAISSDKYDGLVISPLQAESVKAKIKGTDIPIVAVNTRIDAPEVRTFVGTGNRLAASMGGEAAVAAAKAAGWETINAICIAGTQGDPTGEDRLLGFKEGVEKAGGTFLDKETQYTDWDIDKSVAAMEGVIQRHPEGIAIILGCADDMAIAAVRAAEGNPAYENTIFCGFDGNQGACESILAGGETLSVAQDAYSMGYQSVDACVRTVRGEKVDAVIDTGCEIISKDNAQARLDELVGYSKQ